MKQNSRSRIKQSRYHNLFKSNKSNNKRKGIFTKKKRISTYESLYDEDDEISHFEWSDVWNIARKKNNWLFIHENVRRSIPRKRNLIYAIRR